MTIDFGVRAETYRLEVRAWLESHGSRCEIRDVSLDRVMFNDFSALDAWSDEVFAAGYMCVSWPREYGGQDLTEREVAVLNEEFARANLPRPTRGLGETLVGPALLRWGNEEQKARLLPRIVDGRDRYCQGFSEPEAGSDLKALTTRGTVDGDDVVISGQKVWTSSVEGANLLFCLCRTQPGSTGRAGISFVIVPMSGPDGQGNGIVVRPIRQPTGDCEFAELFLDQARAPLGNVVGGIHNGWRVAMSTLGSERAGATTLHVPFRRQFWRLVDVARDSGAASSSACRQILARAYTDVELIRFNGLRALAADLAERPPGASSDLTKLQWSEHAVRFANWATNIRGADGMLARAVDAAEPMDEWSRGFLFAPAYTIAGGTSEVIKDGIAERTLGLPRDKV